MKRVALILLVLLLVLAGAAVAEGEITSKAQLNQPGMRVGVGTGTTAAMMVEQEFPNAELVYLEGADGYEAVALGKIDAYVYERQQMELAIASGRKGVHLLDENMEGAVPIAVGISPASKTPDLEQNINAFIAATKADGTLDDMFRRWVTDSDLTMPDIDMPTDPKLHIIVGTTGTVPPFSFYSGDELVGYDIEMARRFAAWMNADVSFKVYDYGAIIIAAKTGDVDLIMANLNIMPERAEALTFSDALYTVPVGIMVKGDPKPDAALAGGYNAIDELDGKRIGVQTGTTFDGIVQSALPNAQIMYFNTKADLINGIKANKIDAYAVDEPVLKSQMSTDDSIVSVPGYLESFEFGFVFPKTDAGQILCGQFDEYLGRIKANGTLEAIEQKWISDGSDIESLDYESLPADNGRLTLATEALYEPFAYIQNNAIVGYDIEIATGFCREYGYALDIIDMSFDGILPSVVSGKCDFGCSGIAITPERAESVLFSEPYYTGGTVLAVLKDKGSSAPTAGDTSWMPQYQSFSELGGKRVSMLTGAPFEELVREKVPDVGAFSSYNNMPDMLLALRSNKTDAALINNAIATLAVNRNPELALFPQNLQDGVFGFAFAKGDSRRDDWQAAFDSIPKETIQAAWEKWTGADESVKTLPEQDWPGGNGTVRVAACDTLEPMSYVGEGGKLIGFDLEVILMIARELDVHVEFAGMEFSAILSSVQAGKADIGAGSIIITAERAESVDFVEYYPAAFVLIVRAEQAGKGTQSVVSDLSSLEHASVMNTSVDDAQSGIAASFHKTFIREDRWKLFVRGVITTLVITLLSILSGTLLGFAIFMMCRNGNPFANGITRFCLWLVQGMPMVVLLMILYYIIFGSVSISGIVVAVVGFTLTFGAAVFGLLKMGVGAVDNGQYEAAYALGYSNRRTFFRIILPQALPHIMPAYKGEIVGLIKATAIVGYIAVQDLTKMGDIVRSRTYEAFFPLIAITIIYFVLEGLIGLIVSRIGTNINPKKRSRESILKGVKTDD